MRRWLPWIVIGTVAIAVIAYAAWPRPGDDSVRAHARRLASELRCVDCQGLSVADSATSTARATRRDLEARIRRGESDAEIRQVYVDRYGEAVLLKPASGGLGAVVWALPIAVILVAAGALLLALRRWQREPTLVASPEDEELVARERERPRAAERETS